MEDDEGMGATVAVHTGLPLLIFSPKNARDYRRQASHFHHSLISCGFWGHWLVDNCGDSSPADAVSAATTVFHGSTRGQTGREI
jgi:hypothetical protein